MNRGTVIKNRLRTGVPWVLIVALGGSAFFSLNIQMASAAASLTSRSDTLETSAFSTAAKHTIKFTTATALTADNSAGTADFSFKATFPTDNGGDPFTIPSLTTSDISATCTSCSSVTMTINAVTLNSEGGAVANDSVLVKIDTGTSGASLPIGSVVTLTLGTGSTKITNPASSAAGCTSDVCRVTLDTTESTSNPITSVDTGDVLLAFNSGVTVSATVSETLTFTIAQGAACAGDTGTSPTSVNGSVTATAVPFGTVNSGTFYYGCQDLTVATNAAGGYAVTSSENTNLKSASAVYIGDTSCDSSCTTSSGTAWATESNNGLGFTCEGGISGNSTCATAGDSFTEYRQFACTGSSGDCGGSGTETPQSVISATAPSAAAGDKNRLHYKLSISAAQAAGTYSNTVTHVATATF